MMPFKNVYVVLLKRGDVDVGGGIFSRMEERQQVDFKINKSWHTNTKLKRSI